MTGQALFNEVFFDDARRPCREPHRRRGQRLGRHPDDPALRADRHRCGRVVRPVTEPRREGRRSSPRHHVRGRRRRLCRRPSGAVDRHARRSDSHSPTQGRADDPPFAKARAAAPATPTPADGRAPRGQRPSDPGDAARLAALGKVAQTRIVKLAAEIGLDLIGSRGHAVARRTVRVMAGSPSTSPFPAPRPSTAARIRSSATSSPSACSACRGKPARADRALPRGTGADSNAARSTRELRAHDRRAEGAAQDGPVTSSNASPTSRPYARRWSPSSASTAGLWQQMSGELGLSGLAIPEEYGGSGSRLERPGGRDGRARPLPGLQSLLRAASCWRPTRSSSRGTRTRAGLPSRSRVGETVARWRSASRRRSWRRAPTARGPSRAPVTSG